MRRKLDSPVCSFLACVRVYQRIFPLLLQLSISQTLPFPEGSIAELIDKGCKQYRYGPNDPRAYTRQARCFKLIQRV